MASDEPKRPGKGRRNDIPWDDIRNAYNDGETVVSELSRRFGVKRDTIAARIKKENWASKGQIIEAARSNVIDLATRKAVERIGEADIEKAADAIASDLLAHSELAALLMEASKQTIEDYKAGKIRPSDKQNMADVFNSVVAGVKNAIHTSREINGLRSGQSSTTSNSDGPRKLVFEIADLPEEELAS